MSATPRAVPLENVLITGGAGFIGGTLVRRLLNHTDWRVINLDALTYAADRAWIETSNDRHVFVHGDINDGPLVDRLLDEYSCDAIVHLAAESHVDRSIDDPASFAHTNVMGTLQLLESARRHWSSLPAERAAAFRFYHISTDEVYGSLGEDGVFCESSPYAPNSPYSASKAASDHFVRAYHQTYGLPTLISHSSNNYGPYQYPEKLIPVMIRNAVAGASLPVYGAGQHVRDWLFVEDHCEAIQMVLQNGVPGQAYHIGGACERKNIDVVRDICKLVDEVQTRPSGATAKQIEFVTDRPGHDFRYALDCQKIERELGWKPMISWEQGLNQTVRWYCENPDWVERMFGQQPTIPRR